MDKKYIRAIVITSCFLVLLIGGFLVFSTSANNQQVVEILPVNNTPTKEIEQPDWVQEYAEQYKSEPASKIASEFGDFYPTTKPRHFKRNEVANRDRGEEITKKTKQVILKGFIYEKK